MIYYAIAVYLITSIKILIDCPFIVLFDFSRRKFNKIFKMPQMICVS